LSRARPVRWGLVAATLLSLALIVALRARQPSFDEKTAPMPVAGTIGQPVQARTFSIKVKRVKLAHAYRVDGRSRGDPPREVAADGVWLSALVEAERSRSSGYVGAQLRTRDGRRFRAAPNGRPDLKGFNLTDTYLATGLPAGGAYFFDVPAEALDGATLQFFDGNGAPAQLDHLVDVDVGLDAPNVESLLAEAAPVLDLTTPGPAR